MNTTDAEKRDEEMQRDRNFYYDNRKVQWGYFAMAEDRDCVGIFRTNAELDANNGVLRKKFYVLQMEEDLRLNGGVERYTTALPNRFFEKPGKHPSWQNFDVVITPADDSLLLVSRAADPEGRGNVNENVRVLYNMNETYLEYYYMQTKDGKNMETLITDNEPFITAEHAPDDKRAHSPPVRPSRRKAAGQHHQRAQRFPRDGVLLFSPARGDERTRQLRYRRLWNKTLAHYKRRHPSRRDEHLDRKKEHSLETLPLQRCWGESGRPRSVPHGVQNAVRRRCTPI